MSTTSKGSGRRPNNATKLELYSLSQLEKQGQKGGDRRKLISISLKYINLNKAEATCLLSQRAAKRNVEINS
jgi:hypothetical protein